MVTLTLNLILLVCPCVCVVLENVTSEHRWPPTVLQCCKTDILFGGGVEFSLSETHSPKGFFCFLQFPTLFVQSTMMDFLY